MTTYVIEESTPEELFALEHPSDDGHPDEGHDGADDDAREVP